jgi:hypothetical protein
MRFVVLASFKIVAWSKLSKLIVLKVGIDYVGNYSGLSLKKKHLYWNSITRGKGIYRVQFTKTNLENIDLRGDLFAQLGLIPSKTDTDLLFPLEVDFSGALFFATERVFDISYVSLMSIKALITGEAFSTPNFRPLRYCWYGR